ncbi:hypothetical protein A8F94_00715 [Bacillus sp. FJAT-27225]|nr:hypothetical protein A8F94_00715 [Bacillus sp. FJAT-27225]
MNEGKGEGGRGKVNGFYIFYGLGQFYKSKSCPTFISVFGIKAWFEAPEMNCFDSKKFSSSLICHGKNSYIMNFINGRGTHMFLWYVLIVAVFVVALAYYAGNLFLPKKRKLKYYLSLFIGFIGLAGWAFILLRLAGGLLTAVVSTFLLILSFLSFITAIIIDLIFYKGDTNRQ